MRCLFNNFLFCFALFSTGFSFVNPNCSFCDYVHNQSAVNDHIYSAMQSLYRIFPTLQGRPVFMTGESYAGHYIPAMADFFQVLGNDATYVGADYTIPIAGLAIGNGWSIPSVQYNYAEFAHNIGIITGPESRRLQAQYEVCLQNVLSGDYSGRNACNIIGEVLAASGACPFEKAVSTDDDNLNTSAIADPSSTNCFGPIVNYYDTRLYYGIGVSWPDGTDVTTEYLNRHSVRKAIHASKYPEVYNECDAAGGYLALMDGLGVQTEIVNLLNRGTPILFYNGQYDLICNHMGNEAMLDQLKWRGSSDFNAAKGYVWTISESDPPRNGSDLQETQMIPAGYGRSTSGVLTMLMVIGGSHMVPYNVPRAAYDMLHRVIHKISFADYVQELTYIQYKPSPTKLVDNVDVIIHKDIIDPALNAYYNYQNKYKFDYLLVIVASLVVVCCCWLLRCCRNEKSSTRPAHYESIPDVDDRRAP